MLPGLFDGRDKAWWFFAWQSERIGELATLTGTVPTAAQKSGQFAEAIIDPLTGQPFANNTIPSSRFDPVFNKLVGFYPNPNTDPGRGFNYVSDRSTADKTRDEIIVKMDFKTGEDSHWSGRFLWNDRPITFVNAIEAFTRKNKLVNWAQNITNTRNFGSNVVNEAGFHFFRRPYVPGEPPDHVGFGPTLGIPGWPLRGVGAGLYGNEPPGGMLYSAAALGNSRENAGNQDFVADALAPTLFLRNPFDPSTQVGGSVRSPGGGYEPDMPSWYVPNWGLSIQQRLGQNTTVEIGYEGTCSVHEMQIFEMNDARPGPEPRIERRPFPALTTYRVLTGNGDQSYNALNFKVEKRPGNDGITMLFAYTWAEKSGHDRRTPEHRGRPARDLSEPARQSAPESGPW